MIYSLALAFIPLSLAAIVLIVATDPSRPWNKGKGI